MTANEVFRAWAPSAISLSILTVELPLIALIVVVATPDSAIDYLQALGLLMFFNAFVFPLCTYVVSNKGSLSSLKVSLVVTFSVFTAYWGTILLLDTTESFFVLLAVFSLSILAVAARRII